MEEERETEKLPFFLISLRENEKKKKKKGNYHFLTWHLENNNFLFFSKVII
jgi:hypothetical protein